MKRKGITKFLMFVILLMVGAFVIIQKIESREIPSEAKKKVTITDDRLKLEFSERKEKTIEEFLVAERITLSPEDWIVPAPTEPLYPGTNIVITRAKGIKVTVDGGEKEITTQALTVGEAMKDAGILLEEDDIVEPERETLVASHMAVTVTRVEIREEVVERSIAYATKVEEDDELSWRTKKVTTKGENGVRQITYRVSYHDGKEVNRKQLSSVVTKEPVTEVVTQGTYVKTGKKHEGLGTWYAHTGTLAAASPWLPFGSYVRVTNEQNGKSVIVVINDRGPFGPNRIIDLDKVAFEKIASIGAGVIPVKVEEITN